VAEDDVLSRDVRIAKVLRDGFPQRGEVRRRIASRIPVLRGGEKSSYGIRDTERIRSQGTIHDPPRNFGPKVARVPGHITFSGIPEEVPRKASLPHGIHLVSTKYTVPGGLCLDYTSCRKRIPQRRGRNLPG
jgi:hypothetical protein